MNLNKKKNILITGADGFIGSHLVEMLIKDGYKIRALVQYNSFNNLGWLEDIPSTANLEIVTGDVRDPFFCDELTKNISIIFHLAALIAIPYSYIAPDSYIDTNIKGTLNLCQSALKNKCQLFVHTSTSEVYGTAIYVPIDEMHPKQPQSPYSASKIGADAIAMSFFRSFNLPLIIARPFNTFGPRQSARAIIPTIISQIASGKRKINVGELTPTRDFNFVKDTCKGLVSLANCKSALGQEINIGTGLEISIEKLIYLIANLMKVNITIAVDKNRMRPKNSEVFRLCCDNTKIKKLINYVPSYSLEEGLLETINWFTQKDNLIKYKSNEYNI